MATQGTATAGGAFWAKETEISRFDKNDRVVVVTRLVEAARTGRRYVDVREHYWGRGGEVLPSAKGICVRADEFLGIANAVIAAL